MSFLLSLSFALMLQISPIILRSFKDDNFALSSSSLLILASLILIQVSFTTLPGRLGRWLAYSALIFLSFSTLLNIVSLSIFKSPVSLSAFVAIFQSNPEESIEFFKEYGFRIGLATSIFLVIIGTLFAQLTRQKPMKSRLLSPISAAVALILLFPTLQRTHGDLRLAAWDIHEVSYTDRLLTSLIRYRGQMSAWHEERERWENREEIQNRLQLEVKNPDKLPDLVIVIIGESTTRHHMGIYGYPRPTTPQLSAMQDHMLIFQDVISPTSHTIPSLMNAFCSQPLACHELVCSDPTLLDNARAAGYELSWISNQASIGFDDNIIVHMGNTADHTYFVNTDASSAGHADHTTSLDERIFGPLEETIDRLKKDGGKHFILVHLMGTHFTYEKRYPATHALFSDQPPIMHESARSSNRSKSLVNHYDNAVLYQDQIISDVFKKIQSLDKQALAVYFSDHGEEVYRNSNFHGHNDSNLTPNMLEIPFFLAYSSLYQTKHETDLERFRSYQDRPFSIAHLTPSLVDLLGLDYDGLDQSTSLFSTHFQPRARLAGQGSYAELLQRFQQRPQLSQHQQLHPAQEPSCSPPRDDRP